MQDVRTHPPARGIETNVSLLLISLCRHVLMFLIKSMYINLYLFIESFWYFLLDVFPFQLCLTCQTILPI